MKAFASVDKYQIERPHLDAGFIDDADAEVSISVKILNELLEQNFPLKTQLEIDRNKQLEITVRGAELSMESDNTLELQVTDATIRFEQMRFKIGIHSNRVALKLNPGICRSEQGFSLVAYGWFSSFDVQYLPDWIARRLTELLKVKFLSPLVNYNVTELLTVDKEIDTGHAKLRLTLVPDDIAVTIDEKGLTLQARFAKKQSQNNETPEEITQ